MATAVGSVGVMMKCTRTLRCGEFGRRVTLFNDNTTQDPYPVVCPVCLKGTGSVLVKRLADNTVTTFVRTG